MSNRLTKILRTVERKTVPAGQSDDFVFGDGRYVARVANDLESREKAYRLVYQLYLEKEYVKPNASRMWLGPFDALPDTVTLLVERTSDKQAVGTLTAVFDSAAGLPADNIYGPELGALRASGRRLAEIVSLGVDADVIGGREVVGKLFNLIYIASRRVRGATDLIVTVNPRHVPFYEKTMLFSMAGLEREYGKVEGAPAVLLRVPLETPDIITDEQRRRTAFRNWADSAGELRMAQELRRQLRPMSEREIRHFFPDRTKPAVAALAEAAL